MVYKIPVPRIWYIDGACRGNGQPGARAAAAACLDVMEGDGWRRHAQRLPRYPPPTNQRAELMALIIALKESKRIYFGLRQNPRLQILIKTDSRYVVGCMTEWCNKWQDNNFTNAAGYEVVNRDLIEEALELEDWLTDLGTVRYEWIPRHQNQVADQAANDVLDCDYD